MPCTGEGGAEWDGLHLEVLDDEFSKNRLTGISDHYKCLDVRPWALSRAPRISALGSDAPSDGLCAGNNMQPLLPQFCSHPFAFLHIISIGI